MYRLNKTCELTLVVAEDLRNPQEETGTCRDSDQPYLMFVDEYKLTNCSPNIQSDTVLGAR
jgi:hypothetical protein